MDERGTRTTRVDTPVVYNHNQMLKEIRNSLKHLRREPENPSETKSNGGAQVIYRGNNITNSQHRVLHVHTNHHGQFNAQRNNFVDPSRQHHEQAQGNRNYDESGYSSSSSECSSQSANDFGGQQFGGNMGVGIFIAVFFFFMLYGLRMFPFVYLNRTLVCKNVLLDSRPTRY